MLDLIESVWITAWTNWPVGAIAGFLVAVVVMAWMAAHDSFAESNSAKYFDSGDTVFGLVVGSMMMVAIWPITMTLGAAFLFGVVCFKLFQKNIARKKRRAKLREDKTPEGMARRAKQVRSDIEARMKKIKDSPDHQIEYMQLELALQSLKAAG